MSALVNRASTLRSYAIVCSALVASIASCRAATEPTSEVEFNAGELTLVAVSNGASINEYQAIVDGVLSFTVRQPVGGIAAYTMSGATFPRGVHKIGFCLTKPTLSPATYEASGSNLYAANTSTRVGGQVTVPTQTVVLRTGECYNFTLNLDF